MRISTGMIYDSGVRSIQSRSSALLLNQQKISSGRRMLSPSDDPVAAARALEVNQAKEINSQFGVTQGNARSTLGLSDGQLSSAGDLLVRVRELSVQAGNAALSESDRKSISAELRARFDELIGLANSTDGTGQYLFSGYQGSNKPFAGSVENGVVYQGDEGQRALRVSSSRNIPVSDSGNDIFMNIKNGNGIFVTGAQAQHSENPAKATLEKWISTVTAPALPANGSFDLRFWVNPAETAGSAIGSIASGYTVLGGTDDQFTISVDGGPPSTVLISPPGAVDDTALNNAFATAVPPVTGATASINAAGQLVVTSNTTGSASSIRLGTVSGNSGLNSIFGTPASVAGANAGTTLYDLVDPAGNSLYTGNPSDTSTALGQAGFLGHAYASDTPINLSGVPPLSVAAFDYGARVTISGAPQLGDVFSLNRSNTGLVVTAAPITATIDAGSVRDPLKWSSTANRNLELRFWVDDSNAMGVPGGAGKTYYDLVDANTGISAFTGTASTTGALGSFQHPYTSGGAIDLSNMASAGPPAQLAFDFGAKVTVSGTPGNNDIFTVKNGDIPGGNGYFVTSPKMVEAVNTGSGIVGTGEVLDAAKWNTASNSGKLEVRFWKDATTTPATVYYDLVDKTTEKSLFTDTVSNTNSGTNTYTHKFTSGDSIPFSGLAPAYGDFGASVTISGTPDSGDVFTLNNSTSESVFSTLERLIKALESSVGTGSNGNTALHNALGSVINNIGQTTDNILRVRADIGSRLSEIDSLENVVQDNALQYSSTLSNLQDIDYAQAITDMTRQQTELEAAQKSFVNISKLSLFNYV
ncbi:MAG: flagellar hook-associated protein FlgL [Sterolibacterium sp.]|nr:flagellar hook-associated protein FlgL [Sterolibacterium sp.]